ncbi:hypothetical protein MHLP_01065 [Candidatus Mycoplasma haematolamae str. Purdue]|uniref:Uncharacterized protein n=1 Tax=Mycoplasma haematolamae (strain Purdue) TaxID=1212765 RepID=I7BIZ1_MYCHA|nr:hypothetical protein [Candidatus Mycoplasma haematolamae]AFO51793.1 hypothetical protein MHLP_01065 [Candidatus Mycoplasma haematolamae str. Purdue]
MLGFKEVAIAVAATGAAGSTVATAVALNSNQDVGVSTKSVTNPKSEESLLWKKEEKPSSPKESDKRITTFKVSKEMGYGTWTRELTCKADKDRYPTLLLWNHDRQEVILFCNSSFRETKDFQLNESGVNVTCKKSEGSGDYSSEFNCEVVSPKIWTVRSDYRNGLALIFKLKKSRYLTHIGEDIIHDDWL